MNIFKLHAQPEKLEGWNKPYLHPSKYDKDAPVWSLNGKPHRVGAPAIYQLDRHGVAMESWYHNGVLHRDDGGPAWQAFGGKTWYIHGKKHRLDGPAHENSGGDYQDWWIDGVHIATVGIDMGHGWCLTLWEDWRNPPVAHRETYKMLVQSKVWLEIEAEDSKEQAGVDPLTRKQVEEYGRFLGAEIKLVDKYK
jgi:hypothetical protein